ncbi:MAG: hypothetical protein AAFR89_02830 [Cyanobacteria bacterium J06633_1]
MNSPSAISPVKLLFLYALVWIALTAEFPLALTTLTAAFVFFYVRSKSRDFFSWLFLTAIIAFQLFFKEYFIAANHHFLLVLMLTSTLLFPEITKKGELDKGICRFLLSAVILISVLQKLLVPEFLSGESFFLRLNIAAFLDSLAIFPFWAEPVQIGSQNWEAIKQLSLIHPENGGAIFLTPIFQSARWLSIVLPYGILISEFFVGIMIALYPQRLVTHVSIIGMLVGVFIFRPEAGFLTLLCVLAMTLTESYRIRRIYLFLSSLFLGLILTGLGIL